MNKKILKSEENIKKMEYMNMLRKVFIRTSIILVVMYVGVIILSVAMGQNPMWRAVWMLTPIVTFLAGVVLGFKIMFVTKVSYILEGEVPEHMGVDTKKEPTLRSTQEQN